MKQCRNRACGFSGFQYVFSYSCAEGAIISIDGRLLTLTPYAHCYDDCCYSDEKTFTRILEELGHDVEVI